MYVCKCRYSCNDNSHKFDMTLYTRTTIKFDVGKRNIFLNYFDN